MTNQSGQTATFETLANLAISHNGIDLIEEIVSSKNPEPLRPPYDDLWPDGPNGGPNYGWNGCWNADCNGSWSDGPNGGWSGGWK
jgi:hypothetical protein